MVEKSDFIADGEKRMARKKSKPKAPESFNAFKWLALQVSMEEINEENFGPLTSAIEHRLGFEEWAAEYIPKAKFRYSGWDLIYEAPYGEIKLEPNTWVVLIPDETGKDQINFMTDEQVELYFNEDGE